MNTRRLMLLESIFRIRKIKLSQQMNEEDLNGIDDLEGFLEHVRKVTRTRQRLMRIRDVHQTRVH